VQPILPYTDTVWIDLVARYSAGLWPLHLAVLAAIAVPAILAWRGRCERLAEIALGGLLAAGWAWVAWGFFWATLADIDFAAPLYAAGFAVQAGLLVLAAGLGRLAPATGAILPLLGYATAIAGLPLVALLSGQPLAAAPVAGLLPGPTAAATLAVAAMARRPAPWLGIVPVAWGFVTSYHGLALGLATAWATGALCLAGAVLLVWRWRAARHARA
jgi:hypothetical protein